MKSLKDKDKSGKDSKEVQEASGLKTAGPEGEITAGLYATFCTVWPLGTGIDHTSDILNFLFCETDACCINMFEKQ